MGFNIEGAAGRIADVFKTNGHNRLLTQAVTLDFDRYNNEQGVVFSATYQDLTPTGANDYFFYIKNTGEKDLNITDFRTTSTVAGRVTIEKVSGTPVGGTALVPANRNFGSSKILEATVYQGVDITGLTSESTPFFQTLEANIMNHLKTSSNLIIPQGTAMAMKRVAATGVLTFTVSIVEEVVLT